MTTTTMTGTCDHRTSGRKFAYRCTLPAGHPNPDRHYYVSTPAQGPAICARCGQTIIRHPATGHYVHQTPAPDPHLPVLETTR